MRKIIISALALLGILGIVNYAYAADTVSATLEYNRSYEVTAAWNHVFDEGTSLGASTATQFGSTKLFSTPSVVNGTRFEANAGQELNVSIFKLYVQGGVGYKFSSLKNFPYYQGTAGIDTALTNNWTWNTVKFRYRDSFNGSQDAFRTERLSTGATYKGLGFVDVSAGVFDDLPQTYTFQSVRGGAGVFVGVSHSF